MKKQEKERLLRVIADLQNDLKRKSGDDAKKCENMILRYTDLLKGRRVGLYV